MLPNKRFFIFGEKSMENVSGFTEEKKLELTRLSIKHIEDSAKWGKFISIVGFVLIGFLLIVAAVMAFVLPGLNMSEFQDMQGMGANSGASAIASGMGPLMAVFYVIGAVLYFIPVLYLFNYSRQSLTAIRNTDSELLTSAFNNMRRQYKFVGILTIIMIGLYALVFIGGFIGGMLSAFV